MIERIGPVCRFGPGGDYESVWPGDWMEQATQPKNAIGRLLDVIAGMKDVLRGGNRHIEVTDPMDIETENKSYESDERGAGIRRGTYAATGADVKHNRGVSQQPGLFADDWRISTKVVHKPNNRIRAHRAASKKRITVSSAVSFDPSQGTLFELDYKGAKTA